MFKTLNAEINPICLPLALLGAHAILHISRIRVNDQVYSPLKLHTELPQISQLKCIIIINIPATFNRVVHLTELPRNHLFLLCDSIRPPRTACQMLEEYTLSLGCARRRNATHHLRLHIKRRIFMDVCRMFTKSSHHRNITVILMKNVPLWTVYLGNVINA